MEENIKTIIPVGNDVKGDITSCKIENQLIQVKKNSALSLQQVKTYAAYDVCSKQIISQYDIPTFTGLAIFGTILLTMVVLMLFLERDPY